ncbi:Mechanosensitive ion channel MscS, partial [Corchorus olitorius]
MYGYYFRSFNVGDEVDCGQGPGRCRVVDIGIAATSLETVDWGALNDMPNFKLFERNIMNYTCEENIR